MRDLHRAAEGVDGLAWELEAGPRRCFSLSLYFRIARFPTPTVLAHTLAFVRIRRTSAFESPFVTARCSHSAV